MALTAIDLITEPKLLGEVKAEFAVERKAYFPAAAA